MSLRVLCFVLSVASFPGALAVDKRLVRRERKGVNAYLQVPVTVGGLDSPVVATAHPDIAHMSTLVSIQGTTLQKDYLDDSEDDMPPLISNAAARSARPAPQKAENEHAQDYPDDSKDDMPPLISHAAARSARLALQKAENEHAQEASPSIATSQKRHTAAMRRPSLVQAHLSHTGSTFSNTPQEEQEQDDALKSLPAASFVIGSDAATTASAPAQPVAAPAAAATVPAATAAVQPPTAAAPVVAVPPASAAAATAAKPVPAVAAAPIVAAPAKAAVPAPAAAAPQPVAAATPALAAPAAGTGAKPVAVAAAPVASVPAVAAPVAPAAAAAAVPATAPGTAATAAAPGTALTPAPTDSGGGVSTGFLIVVFLLVGAILLGAIFAIRVKLQKPAGRLAESGGAEDTQVWKSAKSRQSFRSSIVNGSSDGSSEPVPTSSYRERRTLLKAPILNAALLVGSEANGEVAGDASAASVQDQFSPPEKRAALAAAPRAVQATRGRRPVQAPGGAASDKEEVVV